MAKFIVNYNTGAGNAEVQGDLDQAMQEADQEACYTQKNITVEDGGGNDVVVRPWCGVAYDGGSRNPICFGDFGYFDDWYQV